MPDLDFNRANGYTNGMKTAISVPDDIFKKAEKLARKTKKSRSQLFSDALRDYLAKHTSDDVTEMMNRVIDEIESCPDTFVTSASNLTLEKTEW